MKENPQPSASVMAYFASEDRPHRSYFTMPLSQLRDCYYQEFAWGGGELEEVAGVEDVEAGGVPARLYSAHHDTSVALVWYHGGGWNLGSVACHEWICRALARQSGCAVLSVDYRLAPENPYPAAIEDAWNAAKWAARHFDRIAVGGDSAGGTLAAATAVRARDAGLPIALQLLVYPVMDYRPDHPAYHAFRRDYAGFGTDPDFGGVFQRTIADIWQQYIPDPVRRAEPEASPLRTDSLEGVAPVFLVIAEHDILKPEEEEFATRLRGAGVHVEIDEYPGQIHGFFPLLGAMPEARTAVERSARALKRAFVDDRQASV